MTSTTKSTALPIGPQALFIHSNTAVEGGIEGGSSLAKTGQGYGPAGSRTSRLFFGGRADVTNITFTPPESGERSVAQVMPQVETHVTSAYRNIQEALLTRIG